MNHNRITRRVLLASLTACATICTLVSCKSASDPTLAIGQSLPESTAPIAKSRGIPETEYVPCVLLRGCGDEAIANIKPYLGVLAGAPIQRIVTDDCFPEMDHIFYLREHLPIETSALGESGAPELTEHYFINGQTTLYVGKDGMIAYIHTSDQPFEFKTWDELIAYIESLQ